MTKLHTSIHTLCMIINYKYTYKYKKVKKCILLLLLYFNYAVIFDYINFLKRFFPLLLLKGINSKIYVFLWSNCF